MIYKLFFQVEYCPGFGQIHSSNSCH